MRAKGAIFWALTSGFGLPAIIESATGIPETAVLFIMFVGLMMSIAFSILICAWYFESPKAKAKRA